MTSGELTTALDQLSELLGDGLTRNQETLEEHAKDVCHHPPHRPDAVVYPQSSEQVAEILRICHERRVPVVPFGTGTGVEGGVVAIHGGISVDTRELNRILRVSVADMDATVQAGVTRLQLNEHLQGLDGNLFFPVDPGADASLGGMAATNASGSAAVRYGTMRSNVLALKAVTATGEIIETGGRARKSSAGYDLTRLLVGSEGTLALITEVTLRLHRKPDQIISAVCPFDELQKAVQAAIAIMSSGAPVARLELLDEVLIGAVNDYSKLDHPVTPTLFLEFHGDNESVESQARAAGDITSRHGGGDFRWSKEREQRDRLWQARYDAYYACLAMVDGSLGYVTDVCVPISNLSECILATKRMLKTTSIPAPLFGHVGDGNFHVVFLIKPGDEAQLAEVERLNRQIVDAALQLDGTCTGEHGVGLGKIDALRSECGAAIDVMKAVKQAMDPHNVMNPGKIFASD